MEDKVRQQRPIGGLQGDLQYVLAALLIWAAIGFGLWNQAHPAAAPSQLALAYQPITNLSCDPS